MPIGAFYTNVKLLVDDTGKFCIRCLRDLHYANEKTPQVQPSGSNKFLIVGETITTILATRFSSSPDIRE